MYTQYFISSHILVGLVQYGPETMKDLNIYVWKMYNYFVCYIFMYIAQCNIDKGNLLWCKHVIIWTASVLF